MNYETVRYWYKTNQWTYNLIFKFNGFHKSKQIYTYVKPNLRNQDSDNKCKIYGNLMKLKSCLFLLWSFFKGNISWTTSLRRWIAITIDLKYRNMHGVNHFVWTTQLYKLIWHTCNGTYGTIHIFAPLLLHDISLWLPVVSPLKSCWQWDSRDTDYFSKFCDAWKFYG